MTNNVDPKVIDRKLAEISTRRWTTVDAIASTYRSIHYAVGDRQISRHSWHLLDEAALDKLNEMLADPGNRRIQDYSSYPAKLEALKAQLSDIDDEFTQVEAPYHENPWSRFFLVQGGHIHASQHCHTLRPTTRILWLPELSGDTEAKAVEDHGTILCTHCFPSAPVEWTIGPIKPEDPTKCTNKRRGEWVTRFRYAECPECGAVASVTSIGNLRQHKRPTD
ncbi:hypothetical protein GS896_25525 [Rhodococcus hoagii]|nr:hypothetical protein [Prescottella equi]MBM4654133.1 hypothetical protein [Prescottella equi]MBM4719607.1 hypothetical protein [Prescottella equi]NKR23405.1 hypothetical protein [Prescottella equi]NKT55983.1 hypothetical protein [Prescottella equi]